MIASGPLTSDALAEAVRARLGVESLAFYDAIAPIVDAGSLDRSVVFAASRYDKETMEGEQDAYLNCPMNREEYEAFIAALGAADQFTAKEFDLLAYLATDVGAVRTRTEILESVWDAHWYGPTKTVDAHVASLRKKLGGHEWIQAVRGVGFRLEPPV